MPTASDHLVSLKLGISLVHLHRDMLIWVEEVIIEPVCLGVATHEVLLALATELGETLVCHGELVLQLDVGVECRVDLLCVL